MFWLISILSFYIYVKGYCHMYGVILDRVLDWIMDLLTTLAHNS
jgi:hypothetical protein